MPSSSKKQHEFMQAVSHSPEFAKKVGVSQEVGKEFTKADKKAGKYKKKTSESEEIRKLLDSLMEETNDTEDSKKD